MLERIAIGPLVADRQRNHAFLSSKLSTLAAWPAATDGIAPFGFVISVDDAGALAARLAAEGCSVPDIGQRCHPMAKSFHASTRYPGVC